MTVPGSNLLRKAARLIKLQTVAYYQDAGRQTNNVGVDVTAYLAAVSVQGSVQAVPLSAYQDLGLDWGKTYVTLYTQNPVVGVNRDVSGDVFVYNNKVYTCRSPTDWNAQDGWNSVLAVMTSQQPPTLLTYVITPPDESDDVVTPPDA